MKMTINISKRFLNLQVINILATIFTIYMLIDDILFFISKPTHTSHSNDQLKSEHFPDIFLCPFPSFDFEQLRKHGYNSDYHYQMGEIHNSTLTGWHGNSSSTPEKVIEDISIIKSEKDCPFFKAKFEKSNSEERKWWTSAFNLTNTAYPSGRCCKVFFPEEITRNSRVLKVLTKVHVESSPPNVEGFQMYFSSKETSHIFKLKKFNTHGIYLKMHLDTPGSKYYTVKIDEEYDLEEDPKVQCKNYKTRNGYAEVCRKV